MSDICSSLARAMRNAINGVFLFVLGFVRLERLDKYGFGVALVNR